MASAEVSAAPDLGDQRTRGLWWIVVVERESQPRAESIRVGQRHKALVVTRFVKPEVSGPESVQGRKVPSKLS